jgi:hypothetical protein
MPLHLAEGWGGAKLYDSKKAWYSLILVQLLRVVHI